MARTHDPALRRQLLEDAVDYVCENGLADLSLRPLAEALGVSPGSLLYHFGSKEQLLMEIIRVGRARQQQLASSSNDLPALWREWTSPRWLPIVRLFFEIYALALQHPDRFPGFLESAVDGWLDLIDPSPDALARADATVTLAVFRGLLLDFCASGDKKRTTRAVERFAERFF